MVDGKGLLEIRQEDFIAIERHVLSYRLKDFPILAGKSERTSEPAAAESWAAPTAFAARYGLLRFEPR